MDRQRPLSLESVQLEAGKEISQTAPAWPDHFPPGCPDVAEPVAGPVFRILRADGDPKRFLDSQSHLERDLSPHESCCRRAGLSSFVSETAAREALKNIPQFRHRSVGRAILTPEQGRIQATSGPAGHHTLWLTKQALADHDSMFVRLPC